MNQIRKSVLLAVLCLLISYVVQAQDYKQNALCVDGTSKLCSTLPVDLPDLKVRLGYNPDTNAAEPGDYVAQINFDYFAWQMFVALNWPADSQGQPSTTSTITSDTTSPRVWEYYKTVSDVYGGNDAPAKCDQGSNRLLVTKTSKISINSFIEPFTSWPLIDSAGNFVVYDIRLNETEANYILGGNSKGVDLSTKSGQEKFDQAWDFPTGQAPDKPGALEIKTAWRVFPKGADASGFFTLPGMIEVDASNSATGESLCLDVTLGLIGMHIMQKISNPEKFSDYWVWATFEHKFNAPNAEGATPSQVNNQATASGIDPLGSCPRPNISSGSWSFFNSNCTTLDTCKPNLPPAKSTDHYLWQTEAPFAKSYLIDGVYGTQVTRCWAIYETALNVTKKFQTVMGTSLWTNYLLVGAQWAQNGSEGAPSIVPFSAPYYLTNTTLETYLQINEIGLKPHLGPAPGSCIACHNMATDTAKNPSDFSFLSGYAK